MRTMKNGMYVLLGLMFMVMTVNCSNKKGAEKAADAAEVAAETENVLKVSAPPFTKFVVVTTARATIARRFTNGLTSLAKMDSN